MKKYAAFLAGLLSLSSMTHHSFADTLKLVSTSSTVVDGVYIYPYNFSVNGAASTTALMCLDYNREITFGEQWNVANTALPTDNSASSINYRADAWIYSQLGSSSASDVQFAAWSIFDPSDVSPLSGSTAAAQQLAQSGLAAAQDQTLLNSGFFNRFTLYLPTSDKTGWTAGTPQDFIGMTPAPEPSSLVLLGSGLIGVAGVVRRKLKRA